MEYIIIGDAQMAKKQETKKVISVRIYADEFEQVETELELANCTPQSVRGALGLTPKRSKQGVTGKLIAKIRELSDEDKAKYLDELEKKE